MHLESIFRSLRFRLSFWNSLVLILLVGLTLLGLLAGMGYALEHELDLLLTEDATEMVMMVERLYPNWDAIAEEMSRKALSHDEREWFGQILGPDGTLMRKTQSVPEGLTPTPLRRRTPASFEEFRIVELPTKKIKPGPYFVCVGSSVQFVKEDIDRLSRSILIAWLAILVVAPLSGYWLAGRATRPLGDIIETASRLQPRHLSERLVLSGAGDELDQLCQVINNLLDRLATYLANQREFLANAAHELRSPLAAMRAGVEVSLDRDRSPDEYRQSMEETVEQCANLSILVNQLLLLAETDSRDINPQGISTPLDALARRICSMFEGVAEQRGIKLLYDIQEVQVQGNINHLRPVLSNLVDNALKFSRSGDIVEVRVGPDPNNPDFARISVADSGEGIPTDDLPRVFNRFFRGDQSRTQEGPKTGTGLGLSICHSIVQAHGGTITVTSSPDKGTRFDVLLPISKNHQPERP